MFKFNREKLAETFVYIFFHWWIFPSIFLVLFANYMSEIGVGSFSKFFIGFNLMILFFNFKTWSNIDDYKKKKVAAELDEKVRSKTEELEAIVLSLRNVASKATSNAYSLEIELQSSSQETDKLRRENFDLQRTNAGLNTIIDTKWLQPEYKTNPMVKDMRWFKLTEEIRSINVVKMMLESQPDSESKEMIINELDSRITVLTKEFLTYSKEAVVFLTGKTN